MGGTNCGGCCGSCGGCARELSLTQPEVDVLLTLGQIPFLPVARKADDMTPYYFEDTQYTPEEYSLILQCLEKKMLISLDYDKPLAGVYADAYASYPVKGSMALTQRGQQVVEMLQLQGIRE